MKINTRRLVLILTAIFAIIAIVQISLATVYPSYNTEQDCRGCHGSDVASRHHPLAENGTFQCTDCHPVQYDNVTQTFSTQVIRNCLICHVEKNHTNVHHFLVDRGIGICSDCHPVVVDNITQTFSIQVTWDCTVCHSTVLSIQNVTPTPTPTSTPAPSQDVAITNFSPDSPVNNLVGDSRNFHVDIDQIADITWFINGTQVQSNPSVTGATYNNTSAALGIWNVNATASNINGNVTYTWTWVVIDPPPPPVRPKINNILPLYSPVNDTVGSSRMFGISIDQNVDIRWLINGNQVQFNGNNNSSSYNNTSAALGTWNVSALVSNINGTDMYSWIWNVTDNVPPQITINSPVNGNTYILNQNLTANWFVSDSSGIAVAIGTYPSGNVISTASTGTKNFSVYAKDNAGNINTKNITYDIHYKFGGFLQPIDEDGGSIFKLGSKVQIRFRLSDAKLNNVATATAKLNFSLITPSITGKDLKPYSTDTATVGGIFKYDSKNMWYWYNVDTKGLQAGTWRIMASINDESSYNVNISLQK